MLVKFLFLLTAGTSLQANSRTYSQTVNISVNNSTLEKVFKEISRQTDYKFVYTSEEIKDAKPVSLNLVNAEIIEVLKRCFADQPLVYTISEKYIVVKRKAIAETDAPVASVENISGKVVNSKGEPLSGVTISVKGENAVTVTNDQGEFMLQALKADAILVVSSIGYHRQEIKAEGKTGLVIRMVVAVSSLDDAIVIAYGTTTKRLNTGSVSKITAEEIAVQPVLNPLSAMQGRAPGLLITTQNGLPGGNIKVQIRGQHSIAAGTDPFFVVDGIPFMSTPLSAFTGDIQNGANGRVSPLNSINPDDIESIEILKDADATALYGSRASNGVGLITTKKGKAGKTKFDINMSAGYSKVTNFISYLGTADYLMLRREAFKNDAVTPDINNAPDLLVYDTTAFTDWQRYWIGGTAPQSDIQASISGGDKRTSFLFSANYHREGSVLPGDSKYTRYGAHLNLQHISLNEKFRLSVATSFLGDRNDLVLKGGLLGNSLSPNYSPYNKNGDLNWDYGFNPVAALLEKTQSHSQGLISNATLQYNFTRSLVGKISFGLSQNTIENSVISPRLAQNPNNFPFIPFNYSTFGNSKGRSYIVEPQLEYNKAFKNGELKILAGASYQENTIEGMIIQGINFSNESLMEAINAAGSISLTSNKYLEYKFASAFSRINYDYKNKYIINFNFRRDGSSRFGPGKEYGSFGSIGAAYIFSKEKFIETLLPFLSFGKIRASYGITGNDQIADYQYLSTYTPGSPYDAVASLSASRIANPDYSWESNYKFEIATELGFLEDRVKLSLAWFSNRSNNQLVGFPLASQTGFESYQANMPATVRNSGLEIDLNALIISSAVFSWNSFFYFTLPKNKLVSYPNLAGSPYANTYIVGMDLSIVKRFQFLGVDPQTGRVQYFDVNKDGNISNPNDFVVVGKTSPDFYGSWGNKISYKNIELDFLFYFVKQEGANTVAIAGPRNSTRTKALDRWQKPGDITDVPQASASFLNPVFRGNNMLNLSSAGFQDASYLRLKNISLSYSFPMPLVKKAKLQNAKIFVQVQNIWTITNYDGMDPETLNGGFPPLKTINAGLNLGF